MIKFKNVTKRYGNNIAVDNVSFNIKEGEFFVLIGPSGCGKTTTLKMINRLIPLSEGYIYFKDKPISDYPVYEMRWDIGYVLQQIALFPHMTIKENIAQVPQMKKWKDNDINLRVDELLTMVGLNPEQFKNRKPDELSGGQRQRVGVVRALAADPPVIIMDEPFSALDPISREKLQDDVEQIDTPEGFRTRPKSDFVKQFMGSHLDTTHNIVNQVKIKDLGINRPVDDNTNVIHYHEVDAELYLNNIYEDLSHYDAVVVNDKEQHRRYLLNREDVFTYLSLNKEDATHE